MTINPPDSLDEILKDIRMMSAPPDDKYGAPDTGVLLYNCGWIAFCGEMTTVNLTDETFKTSMDAARFLWNFMAYVHDDCMPHQTRRTEK